MFNYLMDLIIGAFNFAFNFVYYTLIIVGILFLFVIIG